MSATTTNRTSRGDRDMVEKLSATEVRARFGAVLERVHSGKECIVVERDGVPVAALVDIEAFTEYSETKREQEDPELQADIREGYRLYKDGRLAETDQLFARLPRPRRQARSA